MENCALCNKAMKESGDNWDRLCPECADKVSAHMDRTGIENQDNAIESIKELENGRAS